MLHYVPTDPGELAQKPWLWIECPDGERYMLLDKTQEVVLPDCAVNSLARQVEERALRLVETSEALA